MKKYELTGETKETGSATLHRIRALIDIPSHGVKAGALGGWIESEKNLSQNGSAWVFGNARVFDDARVFGFARVFGSALVCGNAQVFGNATIKRDALIKATRDCLAIGAIGSRDDTTTFYRGTDGGIDVSCGCFSSSHSA